MQTSVRIRTRSRAAEDAPLAAEIGQRVRAARLRAGLTQQQVAGTRYTKAYVSAVELGRAKPSMAALNHIAAAVGVEPADLLREPGARPALLEADVRLASGDWQGALDLLIAELDIPGVPVTRARILRGIAEARCRLDRGDEAVAPATEAVALFERAGLPAEAAIARYWLAYSLYLVDNLSEARAHLTAILEALRAGLAVDPDFDVRVLISLANVESRDGSPERALGYLNEARGRAAELDDRRRGAFLFALARTYRESGDYEAALRSAHQALALFQRAEADAQAASIENELALLHLRLGQAAMARSLAGSSRAQFERLRDERWLPHVIETQAEVELAADALDPADAFASEALARARSSGNRGAAISALLTLARVARRRGDTSCAAARYAEAAAEAGEPDPSPVLADILGEWSEVAAEQRDYERAYELGRRALRSGRRATN